MHGDPPEPARRRRRARTPRPSFAATLVAPQVRQQKSSRPRRISAEFNSSSNAALRPIPYPLLLQRRASHTVRKHALRGLVRVSVLVTADLLTLALARAALHGIGDRGWLGGPAAAVMRALIPRGTYQFVEVVAAVMLGLVLFGNYQSGDGRRDGRALVAGASLGLGLTAWSTLWSAFDPLLIAGAAIGMAGFGLLLLAQRAVIDLVVRRVRLSRGHPMRTIVVGRYEEVQRALANAALSDPSEFQMLGFVDISAVPHLDALGDIGDVVDIITQRKVDTMVLSGAFDERQWTHLVHVADAAGCHVITLPGTLVLEGFEPQLRWCRGVPLVEITRPSLRGHQLVLKRMLDLGVAAGGLLLLAPVMLGIAVAVKVTSRGPIFFRQTRVGRGGRMFDICKFRSMVVDAEEQLATLRRDSVYDDGRLFKVERDPRTTRVGAFLRRTSLDELPQLWNVLVGEMSLVGPRPPLPTEVRLYDDHHYTRFDVKPGITGPWQVSGRNRIRDFEEVMKLETAYIRQWGIGKDIGILLRTVPAVLRMDGAY